MKIQTSTGYSNNDSASFKVALNYLVRIMTEAGLIVSRFIVPRVGWTDRNVCDSGSRNAYLDISSKIMVPSSARFSHIIGRYRWNFDLLQLSPLHRYLSEISSTMHKSIFST